jgi:hypothetical protein
MEPLLPPGIGPLQKDFFSEQDMLVVVWERHLEPYLHESLVESRFGDVPVKFYDDWLNARLRDFVPIGEYRIEDGLQSLESVKRRFTENQLDAWIKSWDESAKGLPHPLAAKAYASILDFIARVRKTNGLVGGEEGVTETWEVFPTPLDRARFRHSKAGIDAAIDRVKEELDKLKRKCEQPEPLREVVPSAPSPLREETSADRIRRREAVKTAIPGLKDQIQQLRRELQAGFQNRYPQLLLSFYERETEQWVGNSEISAGERESFLHEAGKKLEQKHLSRTDRVLILWLIQLLAERARRDGTEPEESLPDYSHVMVDEAQQYDPLVLRLFCRLARPPFNSVTLVGDLRQRLREQGGVVMWDDLGVAIPEERRARLLVNHRWAEATFRALQRLARLLELPDVELKQPLQWLAGLGVPAEYQLVGDPEEELKYLVDRINGLRSLPGAERWSIALLLPDEYAALRDDLITALDSVAINASWTIKENVRAGKEGVTLTNAESVVGLEFDAVLIAGAQHLLPTGASEIQRQRFWVMATRARQHLCVTSSGQVPLLTRWLSDG